MLFREILQNNDAKENFRTYVIAEIGQNHQGDLVLAKKLINSCAVAGADCVKFQKSNLERKFTFGALALPYDSENSFGFTYGEHKRHLEFSEEDFRELQAYAMECKIEFSASAMDEVSLDFLVQLGLPFIKIGSGDTNNFPLLKKAAKAKQPIILSTGMQHENTIRKAVEIIIGHSNFPLALLHCVSGYPQLATETNLNLIPKYREEFPNLTIGYSGHEEGTAITLAAVALGAKIVERHVTLNKTMKGTDHKCSLLPKELKQLIQEIRTIEAAIGQPVKNIQTCEIPCKHKLGKTLVAARNLTIGHFITENDINVKVSVPRGIEAECIDEVIGKICKTDILEDSPISWENLSN